MYQRLLTAAERLFICLLGAVTIDSIDANHALAQPQALAAGITVELLTTVSTLCTRMALDPVSSDLYYLELYGNVHRIDMQSPDLKDSLLYTSDDHHIINLQCITFIGRQMFLIGNVPIDTASYVGLIMRRSPTQAGLYKWDTVAYTEPYPKSNTAFDHGFSCITANPTGDSLYFNSGSRTDHGEEQSNGGLYPGVREVPLTSAIFRISANSKNLYLPNDSAALTPYLFADGTRNSFDIVFGPGGEIFATENSGERDDPEELNWIRKGRHYGFPWRIGGNTNPQQFVGYDPYSDPILVPERNPPRMIYFYDDPDFPAPPSSVEFTDGILNLGPDANYYRDSTTGLVMQADETGKALHSFTPHRSPLGLVFDLDHQLASPYCGDAFMLSYQTQGDSLGISPTHSPATPLDPSEDLIHLELTKDADGSNYSTFATRIVSNFSHPVDAVMSGNIIYVLEISAMTPGNLWKVTMPAGSISEKAGITGCIGTNDSPVAAIHQTPPKLPDEEYKMTEQVQPQVTLDVYPSPFTSTFDVKLHAAPPGMALLILCDALGKEFQRVSIAGSGNEGRIVHFDASSLPPGIYLLSGLAGNIPIHRAVVKSN